MKTRINAAGRLDLRGLTVRERLEWLSDRSGDCWVWTGKQDGRGYGQIKINGRHQRAHRVSYQEHVGAIPEGLDLDHLCRNRACIKPDHLEPVTRAENTRRAVAAHEGRWGRSGNWGNRSGRLPQTHCKRGHEFTEANTYRPPGRPDARFCIACQKLRRAERTARENAPK